MKVKLLKDHEHGGVAYKAGDEIEVTADEAKWLAETGREVIAAGDQHPQAAAPKAVGSK